MVGLVARVGRVVEVDLSFVAVELGDGGEDVLGS